jgi:hypothetical protein
MLFKHKISYIPVKNINFHLTYYTTPSIVFTDLKAVLYCSCGNFYTLHQARESYTSFSTHSRCTESLRSYLATRLALVSIKFHHQAADSVATCYRKTFNREDTRTCAS